MYFNSFCKLVCNMKNFKIEFCERNTVKLLTASAKMKNGIKRCL